MDPGSKSCGAIGARRLPASRVAPSSNAYSDGHPLHPAAREGKRSVRPAVGNDWIAVAFFAGLVAEVFFMGRSISRNRGEVVAKSWRKARPHMPCKFHADTRRFDGGIRAAIRRCAGCCAQREGHALKRE